MQHELFSILDTVESTNNYAIEKIKEGFGINGKAWFAKEQTAGKGQRGKTWVSEAGKNIILSIILKPSAFFADYPFHFSALVASTCRSFMAELTSSSVKIKWPNDLYINDRKAGGILIENIYAGNTWEWAIIGIGINVNQVEFDADNNKTSILTESKVIYDPLALAIKLHQKILEAFSTVNSDNIDFGLVMLNEHLHKKNEAVCFIKDNEATYATIKSVNKQGQLITYAENAENVFNVGDVVFGSTPNSL
jgi:BirA family transcriptional regulator, biotin operon repressor / biotin---[acetyl-CoA-carboxylase] ligase